MAVSPIVFILWIAVAARVTNIGGQQFATDPESLRDGLEAHVPFVRLARQSVPRIANETTFDDSSFVLAVAEAKRCPPTVEATRLGASSSTDFRAPICSAQQEAFGAGILAAKSALSKGRHGPASRYLLGSLWIARILRYADSSSLARSNSQISTVLSLLEKCLPHLQPGELKGACDELLEFEFKRGSVVDLMRIEHSLFNTTLAKTVDGYVAVEAAKLASVALQRASRGEELGPIADQVKRIADFSLRNEVWSMIVGWDLALHHEEMNQRKVRSTLVGIRSREMLAAGIDPRSVFHLGLPEPVLAATVSGIKPEFVVTSAGGKLLYSDPPQRRRPAQTVAVR